MAIAFAQHTSEDSGALASQTTTLRNNAKIAYMLFTGIVKDKVGYTVREIAKNAWEVSPPDKPFLLDLPTRWSPRLRIRDFGPGLSHHFMMNRFAVMGDSTKDTNGVGGVSGWGLGSKSPLAYLMEDGLSGSFSVIAYRAAIASHYIIALDQGGMPQVKHFMDVPTEEPDGLEVSFAVRTEDFGAFEQAARRILWSFEPRPIISPDLRFQEAKVAAKGGNWTMFEQGSVPFHGPQVRVGPVMYPIDMNEISGSIGFLNPSDLIIFDLPPEDVSPTASREQLQYTSSTKRALSAMVVEYEKTFIEEIQKKVDTETCYFGGCEAFHTATSPLGYQRSQDLKDKVSWGGQPIRGIIEQKVMLLRKGWSQFERFRADKIEPRMAAKAKVVVEHSPYQSLDRFLALDLSGEEVLWARVKKDDLPDFLSMCALKEDDVIILDKAPLAKRPSTQVGTRNNQVRRRRMFSVAEAKGRTINSFDFSEGVQTVDLALGGIKLRRVSHYYSRKKDSFNIGPAFKILTDSSMQHLIQKCIGLGVISSPMRMLIDTGVDELGDEWVDFGDYLEKRLLEIYDVKDVTPQTTTKTLSAVPHALKMLVEQTKDFSRVPDDIRDLRNQHRLLVSKLNKATQPTETVSDRVFDSLDIFKTDMVRPLLTAGADPVDKLLADYDALQKKYPLLEVIRSNSYYGKREESLQHYFDLILNQKG